VETNFQQLIPTKKKTEKAKKYIYLYKYQTNQPDKIPPDQNFFFHLPLNLDQNFVGLLVDNSADSFFRITIGGKIKARIIMASDCREEKKLKSF